MGLQQGARLILALALGFVGAYQLSMSGFVVIPQPTCAGKSFVARSAVVNFALAVGSSAGRDV